MAKKLLPGTNLITLLLTTTNLTRLPNPVQTHKISISRTGGTCYSQGRKQS